MRVGAGAAMKWPQRVLVTASVMLPRDFPEGTSGEGGTRLAGRDLEADASITPRTSHGPHQRSDRGGGARF